MEQYNYNTEREKSKHLNFSDRSLIQFMLREKYTVAQIAKVLNCSRQTVYNEIKRGTVNTGIHQKRYRYLATEGQNNYEENRKTCHRTPKLAQCLEFIQYVIKHFKEDHWSINACLGKALRDNLFQRKNMVCVKTLYNYIEKQLLCIRNIDLPLKLRRQPKNTFNKVNKRILGRSIEERPKYINERKEFGHWELDLVIGKRNQSTVLMVLIERKTRKYIITPLPDKKAQTVNEALKLLIEEYDNHEDIFKTITTDNGSEFSLLYELEDILNLKVYYTHPFTSCEKGCIEKHNSILRYFIKKGDSINKHFNKLFEYEKLINNMPKKILNYMTPEEAWNNETNFSSQK